MCLGIPGRVDAITDPDRFLARVDIGGVQREVNLICVAEQPALESLVGQWVLVHVGFAMSVIDEEEAARTLDLLEQLGDMQEELEAMDGTASR